MDTMEVSNGPCRCMHGPTSTIIIVIKAVTIHSGRPADYGRPSLKPQFVKRGRPDRLALPSPPPCLPCLLASFLSPHSPLYTLASWPRTTGVCE